MSTSEFLSPWSEHQYWSFNPRNISVVSPSSRHDRYRMLDESMSNERPRQQRPVKFTTLQAITAILLGVSLLILGGIAYLVLA